MTLFEELSWRGLVHQATHPELPHLLEKERLTLYCGIDPTADSMHIGHLLLVIGLLRFQRAGHRPIAVIGGGTGMIGDPSGKTQERQLLDAETMERNQAAVEAQLRRFLSFEGENAAMVVNNLEWLGEMKLIPFLRDIGKLFSVNVMMSRESVRARLQDREQGISYTEFSYQLLQALDFLELYDRENCRLQIGGSDQYGNIVAGMDLTRRMRPGAQTYGLTFPLVTKSDGTKFGKTESGTVWLDATRTSPYKFYQFWINTTDADAARYLRYFTFMSEGEIAELEKAIADAPEQRAAQRRLAEEMTRFVHGDAALQQAQAATQAMFGGELRGLDDATLEDVFSHMPSTERPRDELAAGRHVVDVLVESGVFTSKGEARRMIQSGGLYLNNARVDAPDATLTQEALTSEHIAVVRKGKKHYHLLKFR